MRRSAFLLGFILLPLLPLFPQSPEELLTDQFQKLERELENYRKNYARLEELFLETVGITEELLAAAGEMTEEMSLFLEETRRLKGEVDLTLAESEKVIEYLKTKVSERPTVLVEADLGWRVLWGATAGLNLVWEPLPWLSLKAGAEAWYTDAFRLAFPLALRLRFGID